MNLEVEKKTIAAMVGIYCKDLHSSEGGLCDECNDLLNYALKRIAYCPFKSEKPACKNCVVHCYAPARREKIKEVMHYAGPKMLFRHPVLSFMHLINGLKKVEKRQKVSA